MTRAALLPTPGDPFLLKLWFNMFEKFWQHEVDALYVCQNSKVEKPVADFIEKMFKTNPKVKGYIRYDHMIEHGRALKELLDHCEEDLVMLIEDDCMIFKSGAVKEQFDLIENGSVDMVGSKRQSSTPNIAEAARNKFGHWDLEAFFWPNLFFIKKEHLLKTDGNFGRADNFEIGQYIKELDWTVDSPVGADTFVWASIQLRAMGLTHSYVDQYHAQAEDLQFFREKTRAWKGDAPWTHLGSLSSMMTNFLFDKDGYPLESRTSPNKPPAIDPTNITQPQNQQDEGPKQDLESRVANVLLAWEQTQQGCDEIAEFREEYVSAIHRLVRSFELRDSLIKRKVEAYKILYGLHV